MDLLPKWSKEPIILIKLAADTKQNLARPAKTARANLGSIVKKRANACSSGHARMRQDTAIVADSR
jgi:hypothetical protein